MPRRRFAKRRPRARRARRAPKRTTVNVNRSLNPIPQRYICKMKYCETLLTNAATGQYEFNLNSLYDPDRSGGGHQPYGYDTLSTMYNRYRVISVGWRIESPVTSGADYRTIHAMPSNDVLITWGSGGYIRENPRCKYITVNPGGTAPVLKGWVSLPSLVGQSKAQYMADDRFQSLITTSPVEAALLYVLSTNSNGNPVQAPIQVTLEFTCEFFDVKHVVQS